MITRWFETFKDQFVKSYCAVCLMLNVSSGDFLLTLTEVLVYEKFYTELFINESQEALGKKGNRVRWYHCLGNANVTHFC